MRMTTRRISATTRRLARGGDDEFDEEEDDELEAEMAALESIRRDKAGAAGGPDKAHINNKPGLKASIEGTRRVSVPIPSPRVNNHPALRGSPPPRAVREPTPDPVGAARPAWRIFWFRDFQTDRSVQKPEGA